VRTVASIASLVVGLTGCHPQPACSVFDTSDPLADATVSDAAAIPRVLVYSGLTGFRHDSIPTAVETLSAQLQSVGIATDRVSDPSGFASSSLDTYGAVIFVSTTGEPLGAADSDANRALLAYIRRGGGFVGVHAVDDAYDGCSRFNAVVGGWFAGHPGDLRTSQCTSVGAHPALGMLPRAFAIQDEFHLLWNFRGDNQVLVTCATEDGTGSMPISWVRTEGAGRVFVTTLGHPDSTYSDARFVDHFLAGTGWVLRQR
jgi:type 1 glutamine amidotransferase